MSKKLDLIGQRFGRLVVIKEEGRDQNGRVLLQCKCDCGNEVIVRSDSLRNGSCKSCGCLRKELSSERNTTHGHSNEKLYRVWRGMLRRCYDPKYTAYNRYGGRGIEVCEEWRNNYESFRDFMLSQGYDEYGPSYENTIDRIDNNGSYCPENCRVVSMKTQSLNKSNNHYITYNLKKMTVTEAAEKNNLTNHQVFNRLDKGWSMKRALHEPLKETSTYTAGNENHSIKEWAEKMGVTDAVIRGRLKTHSMEEIYNDWKTNGKLEVNDFSAKYETADGKTLNRTEWCNIIGINEATFRKLLKTYTVQEIYNDWIAHDGRLSLIRSNKPEVADGWVLTRKEWAAKFGIAEKTLRKLLEKRTIQELLDEFNEFGRIKMFSASSNLHTADGITECLTWWARRLEINECTLRNYLKKRTMQEIANEYHKNGFVKVNDCSPKFHTVDGITHGQKEWSEILGIPLSTLKYKMKKKTLQEIVDELRFKGKNVEVS